jgi:stringent starvation protein B
LSLNGDKGKGIVYRTVKSGEQVSLSASGSSDPDGNGLSYSWWQYREAGSYAGAVSISASSSQNAQFVAPTVTSNQTVHVILQVTDNGSPALTSYRRMVVTVEPTSVAPPPPPPPPSSGSGTSGSTSGSGGAVVSSLRWESTTTGPNTKDEAIITLNARDNGDGRIAVTATVDIVGGSSDDDYMVDPWVKMGTNKQVLFNGRVGGIGATRKVPFTRVVYFNQTGGSTEWSVGYENYYDGVWAAQTGNGPESSTSTGVAVDNTSSSSGSSTTGSTTGSPPVTSTGGGDSGTIIANSALSWDSITTGPNTKDEATIRLSLKDNGDGRVAVTATVGLQGGAGDNDYMVNPWVKLGSSKVLLYSGKVGGIGADQKVPFTKVVYFPKPAAGVAWSAGYDNYYDSSWVAQTGKGGESSASSLLTASSSGGTSTVGSSTGSTTTPPAGSGSTSSTSTVQASALSWDSRTTGPNSKDEALIRLQVKDSGDGRLAVTAVVGLDGGAGDNDYMVNPWVTLNGKKQVLYSGRVGGIGANVKVPFTKVVYFDKPTGNVQWSTGYDNYFDASWTANTGKGAESSASSTVVVASTSSSTGGSVVTTTPGTTAAVSLGWDSRSGGPNTKDEAIIRFSARELGDGRIEVTATVNLIGGASDDDYIVNPYVQLGSSRQVIYSGKVGGQGASQKVPYAKILYFAKPPAGAQWVIGYENYFDASWSAQTGNGAESSGGL